MKHNFIWPETDIYNLGLWNVHQGRPLWGDAWEFLAALLATLEGTSTLGIKTREPIHFDLWYTIPGYDVLVVYNPTCKIIFIVCLMVVHFMTQFSRTHCNRNGEYLKSLNVEFGWEDLLFVKLRTIMLLIYYVGSIR